MKKKIHKIIPGTGEYPSEDESIWCHLGMIDRDYDGTRNWENVTCKLCLKAKERHDEVIKKLP